MHPLLLGSFILYWVLVMLASLVHLEVAYSVYAVIAMPSFWLSLLLCVIAATLPVLASKLASRMLTPLPSQLIQEIERLPRAVRAALLASGPLGTFAALYFYCVCVLIEVCVVAFWMR